MRTANSSPPSRPHNSLLVTAPCSRRETSASKRSPTRWPKVSLTCLKRSRSIIKKAQRFLLLSVPCIALPRASVSCNRLGSPVNVSKRAIWEILSADSRCSVTSEPTPRKPMNTPLSLSFGDADNSHQRILSAIWTRTIKLLKLSRRFNFSAKSCRLEEKFPESQALPAISLINDSPSISLALRPSAKANLGLT